MKTNFKNLFLISLTIVGVAACSKVQQNNGDNSGDQVQKQADKSADQTAKVDDVQKTAQSEVVVKSKEDFNAEVRGIFKILMDEILKIETSVKNQEITIFVAKSQKKELLSQISNKIYKTLPSANEFKSIYGFTSIDFRNNVNQRALAIVFTKEIESINDVLVEPSMDLLQGKIALGKFVGDTQAMWARDAYGFSEKPSDKKVEQPKETEKSDQGKDTKSKMIPDEPLPNEEFSSTIDSSGMQVDPER